MLFPVSVRLFTLYVPVFTCTVVPPLTLRLPYWPGARTTLLLPALAHPVIPEGHEPEMFWLVVGGAGLGAGGVGYVTSPSSRTGPLVTWAPPLDVRPVIDVLLQFPATVEGSDAEP